MELALDVVAHVGLLEFHVGSGALLLLRPALGYLGVRVEALVHGDHLLPAVLADGLLERLGRENIAHLAVLVLALGRDAASGDDLLGLAGVDQLALVVIVLADGDLPRGGLVHLGVGVADLGGGEPLDAALGHLLHGAPAGLDARADAGAAVGAVQGVGGVLDLHLLDGTVLLLDVANAGGARARLADLLAVDGHALERRALQTHAGHEFPGLGLESGARLGLVLGVDLAGAALGHGVGGLLGRGLAGRGGGLLGRGGGLLGRGGGLLRRGRLLGGSHC